MARIDDYKESFRLAAEKLKSINPHRAAKLSGGKIDIDIDEGPRITIPFFNKEVSISIGTSVVISEMGDSREIPLQEKIVICHYLLGSDGRSLTDNLITFRDIPDGHFYFSAFQRRATNPLLATFGTTPHLLIECGKKLGASKSNYGDFSITVPVLPKIPLTLLLWEGDDEFPPDANILFDKSIIRYLPIEDVAVMSGMTVYKLMRIKKELEG